MDIARKLTRMNDALVADDICNCCNPFVDLRCFCILHFCTLRGPHVAAPGCAYHVAELQTPGGDLLSQERATTSMLHKSRRRVGTPAIFKKHTYDLFHMLLAAAT